MRLATFRHRGARRSGVVSGDALHPLPGDLTALIREGPEALGAAARAALRDPGTVPVPEAGLLSPVDPPTVRDFVAFEEHVEGVRKSVDGVGGVPGAWYDAPAFYFTNPYAVVGTGADIAVPPGCSALDFELEVAAVIGVEGSDLAPERAGAHIAGYTVLNDWSARDLQSAEMKVGLGPAKGKDFATTLGPWLVTPDELEPYRDSDGFLRLGMTVSVNGVEIGRDLLSNMGWPFEELVAYASRGTAVRPGDVLGSGTCGNGGCLAELWGRDGTGEPPPLQPGDTVTMTVDGIGTISNTVVAGADPIPLARARRRDRARPATG
ncbi:2-keto-4-pentenoate hydratase/2-oxohepta-3-ene-1,7-dioic acid hydratase in catechol pathway [Lipingzhangella halophila]|uniref:2-keto-4-pentenoate hydratase/2-oxohepta-3-ene-1,7-dioic acid hydratase in catechol pathway n=1 Tax=Lipingzhangella halophila TaxID=1783352 RepID=A0A7W7RNL5_9ACTN|nr:fumarylacetoacetate hydrolase family protein [Lipingzhangella halophila]MBB4935330.1 2-keto-4-pentenoate hydratase/2-oxohepta-3-ene-1,7-dioic acid hydratase in catechol pathway [Lipingzhangella halophila]